MTCWYQILFYIFPLFKVIHYESILSHLLNKTVAAFSTDNVIYKRFVFSVLIAYSCTYACTSVVLSRNVIHKEQKYCLYSRALYMYHADSTKLM